MSIFSVFFRCVLFHVDDDYFTTVKRDARGRVPYENGNPVNKIL